MRKRIKATTRKYLITPKKVVKEAMWDQKKEKYKTYRKQNGKIKFFICNLIKYKLIKLYN